MQKIKKCKSRKCPNCGADLFEVWFRDNHGMEELLEVHCNVSWCKYAEDGEGNIRHEAGSTTFLDGRKSITPK
ncbi:MAG: hypothetical protein Fur0024_4440 [Patescibacteria group bacterium]